MALVDTNDMLLKAKQGRYGVGAFNIENMEMAQAVIEAGKEMCAPVICAVSQNALKYATANLFYSNVACLAAESKYPVAIHLDHAESIETVLKALRGQFTSIMIDGSKLSFEDNVKITKNVVDMCKMFHIPVEGELGPIGGKMDSVPDSQLKYTDPALAQRFVEETGVNSLAVAIGSSHGIYKQKPCLDVNLLESISSKLSIPFVLHGASGIPNDQIQECIEHGICKINYATELRLAFTNAIREFIKTDDKTYDPKVFGRAGRDAVKQVVKNIIKSIGSENKCK